jgi:hypothetical protein
MPHRLDLLVRKKRLEVRQTSSLLRAAKSERSPSQWLAGAHAWDARSICSPLRSNCEASACAAGAQTIEFELRIWRRRPDLNRGWRFCRQGWIVYLVDSSCFLVGSVIPLCLALGRYRSQIVPKFIEGVRPCVRERVSALGLARADGAGPAPFPANYVTTAGDRRSSRAAGCRTAPATPRASGSCSDARTLCRSDRCRATTRRARAGRRSPW